MPAVQIAWQFSLCYNAQCFCRQKQQWLTNVPSWSHYQLILLMWWHISIIVSPNTDNIYVLAHGYWCRDTLKTSIVEIWYWLHSSNLFVGKTSLAQGIVPIEIIISGQLYLSVISFKRPLTNYVLVDGVQARVLREFSPEEVTLNIYTMVDVLLHHIHVELQHGHALQVCILCPGYSCKLYALTALICCASSFSACLFPLFS